MTTDFKAPHFGLKLSSEFKFMRVARVLFLGFSPFLVFSFILFIYLKVESINNTKRSLRVCSQLLQEKSQECSDDISSMPNPKTLNQNVQVQVGNFAINFLEGSILAPYNPNTQTHEIYQLGRDADSCNKFGDDFFLLRALANTSNIRQVEYATWNTRNYHSKDPEQNSRLRDFESWLTKLSTKPENLLLESFSEKNMRFLNTYEHECSRNYFSYVNRHYSINSPQYDLVEYIEVFEGHDFGVPKRYLVIRNDDDWLVYREHSNDASKFIDEDIKNCMDTKTESNEKHMCIAYRWNQDNTVKEIENWVDFHLSLIKIN